MHVESGADISYPASGFPVGINGEIYSVSALRRLRDLMPQTLHSEYLIFYFTNNPGVFRLNPVDIPEYFRRDWRLTLDEVSDLELFERIFSTLDVGARAIAFEELVDFFATHPAAASINRANRLRYTHDAEFVARLNQATTIPARNRRQDSPL